VALARRFLLLRELFFVEFCEMNVRKTEKIRRNGAGGPAENRRRMELKAALKGLQ
jgi:hypothetical protein